MTQRSVSSSSPPSSPISRQQQASGATPASESKARTTIPDAMNSPVTSPALHAIPDDWQYESAVKRVEGIIHNIEGGDMELAAIFDQFAIAVEQLQACESFLKHHRQQVDLLVETLTDEANF